MKLVLFTQKILKGFHCLSRNVPTFKEDPSFADALSAADAVAIPKTKYRSTAKESSSGPMTFAKELQMRKSKLKPMIQRPSGYSLRSKNNIHSLYLAAPPDNCLDVKEYPFAASKRRHELERFGYSNSKYIQKD